MKMVRKQAPTDDTHWYTFARLLHYLRKMLVVGRLMEHFGAAITAVDNVVTNSTHTCYYYPWHG